MKETTSTIKLLTPEDIANIFGVSYHKALDIIKNNFNYIKIGNQYRISEDEVVKLISSKGIKLL
jgi:excisionase family DNA binding protein